ncbi:MAG: HPr family phosphocarrier protein [Alphaproteobacteria bacterium]
MSDPISVTVRLTNRRGLHARASHKFVACALGFNAVVKVTSLNDVCAETVTADSVMELLLLGSAFGEEIVITASGAEASGAISALESLVKSRFGEAE